MHRAGELMPASARFETIEAFLRWEERQDIRYEYDGTQAIPMMGGTVAHATIQQNLAMAVGGPLYDKAAQFFGVSLKVQVAGRIRYPDGFVTVFPAPMKATVIKDPVVIFEVLGDETVANDVLVKNKDYSLTPSIHRYVMLSQDAISGMMFERTEGDWVGRLLSANSILHMPELGLDVPLAEFYAGLDLLLEDGITSARLPESTNREMSPEEHAPIGALQSDC